MEYFYGENFNNRISSLEEGKSYILSFENDTKKLNHIKILTKLNKSSRIYYVDSGEKEWIKSNTRIVLLDEVPEEYFRKEKLEKLKENT